eukprot:Lithocolla_globosa_v1_NODE_276_length_4701_cov_75.277443.p2 type:complete len:207 gc:universal NODE_276_length_4701_cov_75.277443:3781-3161(-)
MIGQALANHNNVLFSENISATRCGFISYVEAYEYYCASCDFLPSKDCFQKDLLDVDWGLPVSIIVVKEKKWILWNNQVDVACFVRTILENEEEKTDRILLETHTLKQILNSVDDEWSRRCLKLLVAVNYSHSKIRELGFSPYHLIKHSRQYLSVLEEISSIKIEAKRAVLERLQNRQKIVADKIEKTERLIELKSSKWSDTVRKNV